jgi:hypothetical protein
VKGESVTSEAEVTKRGSTADAGPMELSAIAPHPSSAASLAFLVFWVAPADGDAASV